MASGPPLPPAPRLAVSCFAGSLGHLVPLLRIALRARDAGWSVRFFLPKELSVLPRRHGFETTTFLPHGFQEELASYMEAYAQRPIALLASIYRVDFSWRYVLKVEQEVLDAFPSIVQGVKAFRPDVVLADQHRFPREYAALAAACRAPLMLHDSEGTLRSCQNDGVANLGLFPFGNVLGPPLARVLNRGPAFRQRWFRLFRNGFWKVHTDVQRKVQRKRRDIWRLGSPDDIRTVRIGTGIAPVESRYIEELEPCSGPSQLGPLEPNCLGQLPAPLARWLEEDDRPVLLVSFGTMIRSASDLQERVLRAVESSGARALWVDASQGSGQSGESVRKESFVPQPDVLAHPAVHGMISHGGAGAIQEALWFGRPLLCIPFMWDQPYNARVVQRLGAGLVLGKRTRNMRKLAAAVARLLQDPELRARARQLSDELREHQGAQRVIDILEELGGHRPS